MSLETSQFYLAQINVARMRESLEHPSMQDFIAQLPSINALADTHPGFIWRMQSGEGDAIYIRAFDDPHMLINLSVWRDVESLREYVYNSAHAAVMRDRRRWFEKMQSVHTALWWIPSGHLPSEQEGRDKLDQLQREGPNQQVFDFKNSFDAPRNHSEGKVQESKVTS
jgi:hypothetical protein